LLKRFPRSEVKVIAGLNALFGGGIHFDGVTYETDSFVISLRRGCHSLGIGWRYIPFCNIPEDRLYTPTL